MGFRMRAWSYALVGLLAFLFGAAAGPKEFALQKVGGAFYVPVRTLPGLRAYEDKARGRILVEGKGGDQKAFFLPGSRYAVIGQKFILLDGPPLIEKGEILLPAGFVHTEMVDWVTGGSTLAAAIPPPAREKPLTPKAPSPKPPVKTAATPEKAKSAVPAVVESAVAFCSRNQPVKRIFLDSGHGGSDLGASFSGVYEKDVVLRFAQLMAEELRRHGFLVSFSRTKDVFLPLDIRSQLARDWKSDIFISLHMNSAKASDAHGTETYILSSDATDADARKLALKENSIASAVPGGDNPLRDILWDMEQTQYLQLSAHLAAHIQKTIVTSARKGLKNRGVRQAPFFVLSRAAMPAVLVELGYLSNTQDRQLLTNRQNQNTLAKALALGVKNYAEFCLKRK